MNTQIDIMKDGLAMQAKSIVSTEPLLLQIDMKYCEYLSALPFQTGVLEIYGTKDEFTRVILETSCGKVDAINLFEHEALEILIEE